MKKLLYLAYPFPPSPSVASIRTWNTAKQLARLGWRVTIVTPDPALWPRLNDPDTFLKKAAEIGLELVHTGHCWPWLEGSNLRTRHPGLSRVVGRLARRPLQATGLSNLGWVPAVKRACASYRPGTFDLILATGSPFVTFPLAQHLAERLRCPYVLDYRDLWTVDHPHADKPFPAWISRMEQRSYQSAGAVTVVSAGCRQTLIQAFGRPERVHIVWNGFDSDEIGRVTPYSFPEPAITYAGTMYPPKRVLDPVMQALRPLSRPEMKWKFHYFGRMTASAEQTASQAGILDRLMLHGEVPRSEVLAASKGSHCAVVITSVRESATLAERGIVTGKVFELRGMGVPILLVAPCGSDAEHVVGPCGRRFSGSEVQAMTEHLSAVFSGPQRRMPPPKDFDWQRLGVTLDAILRDASIKLC